MSWYRLISFALDFAFSICEAREESKNYKMQNLAHILDELDECK